MTGQNNPLPFRSQDSILRLHFSSEVDSALLQAGIRTIGALVFRVEHGRLDEIDLGEDAKFEIINKIQGIEIQGVQRVGEPQINTRATMVSTEIVHSQDSIRDLHFSTRTERALLRAGIRTIGALLDRAERDKLHEIWHLGDRGINEIAAKLQNIEVQQIAQIRETYSEEKSPLGVSVLDNSDSLFLTRVIQWLVDLVNRQIQSGLLHKEAKFRGKTLAQWIEVAQDSKSDELLDILQSILAEALNISDELELIFARCVPRDIRLVTKRYSSQKPTLEILGQELGVTRERVRQILNHASRNIIDTLSNRKASFIRIQTCLLIARDMGGDITYHNWLTKIRSSGLLGTWYSSSVLGEFVPEDLLSALLKLLDEANYHIVLPSNLKVAIQNADEGRPNMPSRVNKLIRGLDREKRKLIRRHTRFSGGVDSNWLSSQLKIEPDVG